MKVAFSSNQALFGSNFVLVRSKCLSSEMIQMTLDFLRLE